MKDVQIDIAVDRAIKNYIKSRKAKIDDFVKKYFSFKGALKIHKKALGLDLIKGPLNIAWSLPYTALRAGSSLLSRAGFTTITNLTAHLPQGFETKVQREIKWLIYTELLEIPFTQGSRKSTKDALFEEILNQPQIFTLFSKQLTRIEAKSKDPAFRVMLEENLSEYASSRTAAADLAGSIITLAVGATAFKKMTPGALATGSAVATAIAQKTAISNFVFGSTLGSLYYSAFPASASMGLLVASIGTIMAALSIITSFAGIIIDPLQTKLGIHQKRLHKFIDCIENDLLHKENTKLELKDRYIARVFDLLDLLKTASTTIVRH